jgi:hypothetical protein
MALDKTPDIKKGLSVIYTRHENVFPPVEAIAS